MNIVNSFGRILNIDIVAMSVVELTTPMNNLSNFTMIQIDLLSQLAHSKGVRDLARRNNMDPAGVSRFLTEVERVLGFKIAIRSKAGLLLTFEGSQVVNMASELMGHLKKFDSLGNIDPLFSKIPVLNFGSRGFLTSILAGIIAKKDIKKNNFKMRFVDSSPQDTLRASLAGLLDVAVHIEKWQWPSTWQSKEAATLTWGLLANADHPIRTKSSLKDTQKYPFIGSSYISNDRIERSTDVFPLKWSERRIGHESQTAFTSKAILLASDHLAFLPLVTMENEIKNGQIKVINITDMQIIQMKLYLSLNQDRVSQKTSNILTSSLEELNNIDRELSLMNFKNSTSNGPLVINKISL